MRKTRFPSLVSISLLAPAIVTAACGLGIDETGLFDGPVRSSDAGSLDGPTRADASDAAEEKESGTDGSADVDGSVPSPSLVELGVGYAFACVRSSAGTISCWGLPDNGRLGSGDAASLGKPAPVKNISDATSLGVGDRHACATHADGAVVCWGINWAGQLGNASTFDASTPVTVVGLSNAKAVVAGGTVSCALRQNGTVACWGLNDTGAVGDGTTTQRLTATDVPGLAGVVQLAAARSTVCALLASGDVTCWGDNGKKQAAQTNMAVVLTPTTVADLHDVRWLGAGGTAERFCAVLSNDHVKCWGDANAGALGDGSMWKSIANPVDVVALDDAIQVRTSSDATCATRKAGGAVCWGSNFFRELGIVDTSALQTSPTPGRVANLTGVTDIAVGLTSGCAIHDGGSHVSCWGTNLGSVLGRGSPFASATPYTVPVPTVTWVGLGRLHACAVKSDGATYCWGWNTAGELGTNAYPASGSPTQVPGLSGVARVGGGEVHTCAVGLDGTVRCFGQGAHGQLGNGNTSDVATPVVFAAGPAKDVRAGVNSTCALLESGKVACAGDGLPGGGATPASVKTNTNSDFDHADEIALGAHHACARTDVGAVYCWGANDAGQLGVGDTTTRSTMTSAVPIGGSATNIAVGDSHSCAVLTDGSVTCWGGGNAVTAPNFGTKKATAIASGTNHVCALLDDQTIHCWGNNSYGQLGSGVFSAVLSDATVVGITNATAVFAGGDETCALLADGATTCWGSNVNGGLGDGTVMVDGIPARVIGF